MLHQLSGPTYSTASVPDRFSAPSLEPAWSLVSTGGEGRGTGKPHRRQTLVGKLLIKIVTFDCCDNAAQCGGTGSGLLHFDVKMLRAFINWCIALI